MRVRALTSVKVDRRAHPRFRLCAAIEIREAEEVLILAVSDLSLGGASVSCDVGSLGQRPAVGSRRPLTVFDPTSPASRVEVTATVTRHHEAGFAVTWSDQDEAMTRMFELLQELRPTE